MLTRDTSASLPAPADLQPMLEEIARMVAPQLKAGKVADYIPELQRVPQDAFGMVVLDVHGQEAATGASDTPFSLQSITKVPALMLALNLGGDDIWHRVGKEPSGTPFNFLAQLEEERGVPRNPFINAGALTVTDYLVGRLGAGAPDAVKAFLSVACGEPVLIDDNVAQSELATAHQNRAIANLLYLHKTIRHDPELVLSAYCRQCAIEMTLRNLARAFLPLARGGFSPIVSETIATTRTVRRVNALMMTCGLYDAVGSFAYRVGLPAKSGVGGGLVAVIPRTGIIATWAPGLDRFGNSLAGTAAMEHFVRMTDLSML